MGFWGSGRFVLDFQKQYSCRHNDKQDDDNGYKFHDAPLL
jgi:hypothetical protein